MFIASGTLPSNLKHIISKHKWGISGDHPEFLKLKLYKHCTVDWIFSFFLNVVKYTYGASLVAQSVKNLPALRRPWFDSWVRKIRWRRERLPTPGFWPGESHGQGTLVGYSP